MPITITPAAHEALAFPKTAPASSAMNLLRDACSNEVARDTEILISSFEDLKSSDDIVASSGGFLRGAIQAWGQHLHLVIRPEDIWFAILVQLNFYMAKNAEKVRHLFVNHEGKEDIVLETRKMCKESLKQLLRQFSVAIQKCIKTDWMYDWIMPAFSTTTEDDEMTANILMMGIMQSYFAYWACETCGIPSITLLGEREDYVKILGKLDRLQEFGEEPTEFASRLKPILSRFVQTFDKPKSKDIKDFWNHIVRADPDGMSGGPPYQVSGWLMGFCYWNSKGHPEFAHPWQMEVGSGYQHYELDGVAYPLVANTDVPVGYAKAPIHVLDWPGHRGTKWSQSKDGFPGVVVAGAVGKRITRGAPKTRQGAVEQQQDDEEIAKPELEGTVPVLNLPAEQSAPTAEIGTSKDSSSISKVVSRIFSWFLCRTKPHVVDEQQPKEEQQPPSTPLKLDPIIPGLDEKPPKEERKFPFALKSDTVALEDQGTLQPVSGWILFGPEQADRAGDDRELDHLMNYLRADEARNWKRKQALKVSSDNTG